MASFLELVRAELVAATAVTDLVAQRIYPGRAEQGAAPPFVVISEPSDVPLNSVDGSAETRLHTARVQVDAYATTYLKADQVGRAVNAVIANLSRPDLSAYQDARRYLYEDESELHRISQDFSVSA